MHFTAREIDTIQRHSQLHEGGGDAIKFFRGHPRQSWWCRALNTRRTQDITTSGGAPCWIVAENAHGVAVWIDLFSTKQEQAGEGKGGAARRRNEGRSDFG